MTIAAEPARIARPQRRNPNRRLVRVSADTPPPSKPLGIAGYSAQGRLCLDPDLHAALTAAHGDTGAVASCSAGCVPRPAASLDPLRLERVAFENRVTWCADDCVRLGGWLPVDEMLRIEQLTGRAFCPAGAAAACTAPGLSTIDDAAALARLEALLAGRKGPPPRPGDRALVLGIGDYGDGIPDKQTARRDVRAMVRLLTGPLGMSREQVTVRENLDGAALAALVAPDGPLHGLGPEDRLTVYISAQGAADVAGATRILAAGATASDPAGLELANLYAALRRAGPGATLLALEVDFAPAALVEPPNLPGRDIAVLPTEPVPGLSVFTAADRDQRPLADPELGTGLFTASLVNGLSGGADAPPIGNGDQRVDAVELYVFTAHRVRVSARKMFGLEQKPILTEAGNRLLARF